MSLGARIFIVSSSPIILSLKMNVNIACRSRNLCHKCDHLEGLKLHSCAPFSLSVCVALRAAYHFRHSTFGKNRTNVKEASEMSQHCGSSPMPLQGAQSSSTSRRFIEPLLPAPAKPLRIIRHLQEQADRAILHQLPPRKPGDRTRAVR